MSKIFHPIVILLLIFLSACEDKTSQTAFASPTATFSASAQFIKPAPVISTGEDAQSPIIAEPGPDQILPECLMIQSYIEFAVVRRVTDGDTIVVEINGRQSRLRYIGIDTPEVHPTLEFLGTEAAERNLELVAGKTLTLYRDQSETDRYGRLLRYVVADGVFVNQILVREGLADAKDYRPDTACSQELKEAEDQARRENRGIWQQP